MSSTCDAVLEAAVRVTLRELDRLISQCLDAQGKPKAPDIGAVMRARSMLPAGYTHTLGRK